jgi:CheY-like chemotaxis protein
MTEPVPAPTPKQKVVLVVDDETAIASTLAIILNHAGFEAHALFSGQEAVAALDKLQPDLLITDVVMPGMTGIEAAIITRSKLPKCKILLFSGQAATIDLLDRARAQGHDFDILSKPIHPSDLLEKLRGQL